MTGAEAPNTIQDLYHQRNDSTYASTSIIGGEER